MINLNKLKFLLFLSLLGCLFFSCNENSEIEPRAENNFVDKRDALNILSVINSNDNSNLSRSTFTDVESITDIPDEEGNVVYYIINYIDNGFVIMSADNRVKPILAYSETDKFSLTEDNYPAGLVEWLVETKDYIKDIRASNIVQSEQVGNAWRPCHVARTLRPGATPPCPSDDECEDEHIEFGPLVQTRWHQRCGFNNLLPVINCASACNRPVAGCVPIAIAQVMRYHNHPSQYNWNDMPNTTGTNSTSLLISDIHTALGSAISAGCSSTGVDTEYNSANVFLNSFDYTSATKAGYDRYVVKNEIANGRPVILSGGRKKSYFFFSVYEGGHMWVTSGYRSSTFCDSGTSYLYFHNNWGWGGSFNGWFGYDHFNPGTHTFNYARKMIYNIRP